MLAAVSLRRAAFGVVFHPAASGPWAWLSVVVQTLQTMAKKVVAVIKLALQAGKANPAPPVGPALGQHGVNIRFKFTHQPLIASK